MNIRDLDKIFEPIDRLDESGLKKVVNSGINLNVIHELREQTPLICAIQNNWFKGFKILIEAGVNVNQNAGHESNPLLSAVSVNNIKMVEILLQNGVDPDNTMCIGKPLHESIRDGKNHLAKTLIQEGADVNLIYYDLTPLMVAALCNNLNLVKTLIEVGADPNIVEWEYDKTALVMVAENGHLDIREAGALGRYDIEPRPKGEIPF